LNCSAGAAKSFFIDPPHLEQVSSGGSVRF
jgi:hypothetical protein